MNLEQKKPNPGSDEALDAGCTCPVLDNNHGRGVWWGSTHRETIFWITQDCPLHDPKAAVQEAAEPPEITEPT